MKRWTYSQFPRIPLWTLGALLRCAKINSLDCQVQPKLMNFTIAAEVNSMAKHVKVLEFDVQSTDPDRRTIEVVRETVKLSADFQKVIEKKYPGVKVKIKRAEGVPVHELVHHILVSIDWHAVASGTEKAIAQFATSQFLNLAKDRVRNMFASTATQTKLPVGRPVTNSVGEGKPAKKRTAVKKANSVKKAATKKGSSASKTIRKKSSPKSKEKGQG